MCVYLLSHTHTHIDVVLRPPLFKVVFHHFSSRKAGVCCTYLKKGKKGGRGSKGKEKR